MTIPVLTGMTFVIIGESFHGKISLNLMLLLLLVNFVSGFRLELMYISLIASIMSSLTYLHDCPATACAAAMVQRNHFLCLYQQIKSPGSKGKFRQVSNCCKRVLEATKLGCANKTKES